MTELFPIYEDSFKIITKKWNLKKKLVVYVILINYNGAMQDIISS